MSQLNKNIAYRWIEVFNEHGLEKLLGLYSPDAMHHSPKLQLRQPETGGKIQGREAMRNWWADAFERLPTLQYELVNLVADDKMVLMEYKRTVTGEPDMMVAEILEIEAGLIIRSRVYHG
jgi:predicted SnoaL-like aldol condensation-catalyzing enzyme